MIAINEGVMKIEGNMPRVLAETVSIVMGVKETIREKLGESGEKAFEVILMMALLGEYDEHAKDIKGFDSENEMLEFLKANRKSE